MDSFFLLYYLCHLCVLIYGVCMSIPFHAFISCLYKFVPMKNCSLPAAQSVGSLTGEMLVNRAS